MIRILRASQLYRRPLLAAGMFRDRAGQFVERHGWELSVDDLGLEFDRYDDLDPTYVIVEDARGDHRASARVMPTTGQIMLNDHFIDLVGGTPVCSPRVWEITRFCVSPRIASAGEAAQASLELVAALAELARGAGVEAYVGCCEAGLVRLMMRAGIATEVLGRRETGGEAILGGRWTISNDALRRLARRRAALAGGADDAAARRAV